MINAFPFFSSDISWYVILYDAPSNIIINNRYLVLRQISGIIFITPIFFVKSFIIFVLFQNTKWIFTKTFLCIRKCDKLISFAMKIFFLYRIDELWDVILYLFYTRRTTGLRIDACNIAFSHVRGLLRCHLRNFLKLIFIR